MYQDKLKPELLQYALNNNLAGLLTQLITAVGVVLILNTGDTTRNWLWTWLGIAVFILCLRLVLHRYLARTIHTVQGKTPEWITRAWRLQKAGLLAAGALWAALIAIGFNDYPP